MRLFSLKYYRQMLNSDQVRFTKAKKKAQLRIKDHLGPFVCNNSVGFNPVQKLLASEFLNKENKQCESITHKTHMHRDFSLDPKTGTTSLIFHYFLSMLQHIFIHAEASNTMDRNPSRPIPWTKKPSRPKNKCKNHAQNHRWVRPT